MIQAKTVKQTQSELIIQLRSCMYIMNADVVEQKQNLLNELSHFIIDDLTDLQLYHDTLLYLLAYSQNEKLHEQTKRNINHLTKSLEKFSLNATEEKKWKLLKSGMAFTEVRSCFSYTITKWLWNYFKSTVSYYSSESDFETIKSVFRRLLPVGVCEKYFEEDYSLEKLAHSISTDKKIDVLKWVLTQFENEFVTEKTREQLFDLLKIYVCWKHDSKSPCRTNARGISKNISFQNNQPIFKEVDLKKEVAGKKFKKVKLDFQSKENLTSSARGILCSLYRETDPVTYASINETELFELDRGVSVALFYMRPSFRLPLESYVGYMAYRNNIPIAYGGGWVFQQRARFGINVLPSFRGGESAFIFSQLIKLYHHHLGVNYFNIEPYQIGQKNPDGIKSGAFWFYYRMGFRPLQKDLAQIAEEEFIKIKSNKLHRTEKKILIKLANSELIINFSKKTLNHLSPNDIVKELQMHVSKAHEGNFNAYSILSKQKILKQFKQEKIKFHDSSNTQLISELCMYFNFFSKDKHIKKSELKIISKMIEAKSSGVEFDFIQLLQKEKQLFKIKKTK